MAIKDLEELQAMLARGGAHIIGESAPRMPQELRSPMGLSAEKPHAVLPHTVAGERYRSKTEQRYAETVLKPAVVSGELRRWWYEPCKGLYLATATTYTPDFLLQFADGARSLEFHEIKGAHIWDKARIKVKLAAAQYPCFRFVLAQWQKGRWWLREIPAA